MNALNLWKWHFLVCRKFSSDEVQTASWESNGKCQKLFKSKFRHMKLLRKWFWSYLELKNECSERLKRIFFNFFANFWVTKLKSFSGKSRQSFQVQLNSKLVTESFLEIGFSNLEIKNECSKHLEREIFSALQILSDDVETISWESEAKCSKLFKWKFGHKKLLIE